MSTVKAGDRVRSFHPFTFGTMERGIVTEVTPHGITVRFDRPTPKGRDTFTVGHDDVIPTRGY